MANRIDQPDDRRHYRVCHPQRSRHQRKSPEGITTGPDGALWFADGQNAAIGVADSTELEVTQQPPAILTAGSPFGLTVEDVDSSGNLVSSFNGTVTVALANAGGATLGGSLSAIASNGVATFSGLSLTEAGSNYKLKFSGYGIGGVTTGSLSVTPAAATQLAITQQPPASITAGSGFSLKAAIEDPFGNVVTTADSSVKVALASNPTGAILGGTLAVTASNGVAAFPGLTLTTAASGYTLQVSTSGLSGATSSAITVTPAAAAQVVITQQPPASVTVNSAFSLQAAIEDAYGNVVTNDGKAVKVALDNNPTGAKLGGTLSVNASSGVATFSGLTLNKVGTGYTLQLTSGTLTAAATNAIAVTKSSQAISSPPPSGIDAPDALLAPLVLDSVDIPGSLAPKKRTR